MGTPLCKSRYMEEVCVEPVAVNPAFAATMNSGLGATPTASTTATISSRSRAANSDPRGACDSEGQTDQQAASEGNITGSGHGVTPIRGEIRPQGKLTI